MITVSNFVIERVQAGVRMEKRIQKGLNLREFSRYNHRLSYLQEALMQGKAVSILRRVALAIFTIAFLATPTWATAQEKLLHRFMPRGADGAYPFSPLTADSSENYYGATYTGGVYNTGMVFELSPSQGGGWTEKILHSFKAIGVDGNSPQGSLVVDNHGNVYGTTFAGGQYGVGTVFELEPQPDGTWIEDVIYSFVPNGRDGFYPHSGLISGSGGALYGTTGNGGTHFGGTVFKMLPQPGGGWTETVLHSFNPNGVDAAYPSAGLALDSRGNLYGVSNNGGANFAGAVFKLWPQHGGGWGEHVLYSFCSKSNCADGQYPLYGGVVVDRAGNVYGTTENGGAYQGGVVFEISPGQSGWTETVVHSFGQGTDGNDPSFARLLLDASGNLYGTTHNGGAHRRGTVFELSHQPDGGWTSTILYDFKVTGFDGWFPFAGLIFDHAGNLLGTTAGGGTQSDGTAFRLTHGQGGWTESKLHSFDSDRKDGANPVYATLVFDKAGDLFGTTWPGGAYNSGVAFELKPNGSDDWGEEIVYSFGDRTNAGDPDTSLIFDSHGNIFGASATGGTFGDWGTVFELVPRPGGGWKQEVLHSFNFDGTDGYYPFGSPVFDAQGNLYGTTSAGGKQNLGIAFQMKPDGNGGWTETILHDFVNDGTDGTQPNSSLTIDGAGNLFGMTSYGGTGAGGTIFEISPDGHGGWNEQILYNFCSESNCADGAYPFYGNLIFDNAGNLYGVAGSGGAYGGGTVFELTRQQNGTWTEQVLYSFCAQANCTDGGYPQNSLVFDAQGNLYGITTFGGAYYSDSYSGTVFKLAPTQGGWTETVLHSFSSKRGDGGLPQGGLVFDASGTHLFGTTSYGGGAYNAGVVFEITP